MAFNQQIVEGNIGQVPELKRLPSGNCVCEFSVACTENYTDKAGQKREETEWFSCVVWGKQAEFFTTYAQKGSSVLVIGKTKTRSWEDNGDKKHKKEVVVTTIKILSKWRENGGSSAGNQQVHPEYDFNQIPPVDEDLPF